VSNLTPEVRETIIQAISAGNYLETAAAYAGVGTSTLHQWLKKGQDPNSHPIYREFAEDVARARAAAEARMVAIVQRAALEEWQAAAWYLERSHHQRWGRRQIITGEDGGPVQVTHTVRAETEARFQTLEQRLLEVEAGEPDGVDDPQATVGLLRVDNPPVPTDSGGVVPGPVDNPVDGLPRSPAGDPDSADSGDSGHGA
jgi:hypothetical protein